MSLFFYTRHTGKQMNTVELKTVIRIICFRYMAFAAMLLSGQIVLAQPSAPAFVWPEGKRAALSLSFDDARLSQVDTGIALLDRYGVKATFFIVPGNAEQRLEGWKRAVAGGHEIGNHSLRHPCTGNFSWSREKALETYTLEQMRHELEEANQRINELLGVTPETFAYPCGQTFVGRGTDTKSYVPLVSELFMAGRGWLDEAPNDPDFCDLAQLMGMPMDGLEFEQLRPVLENARQTGQWIVLAGHEMGRAGQQTTRMDMLEKLIQYAQQPDSQIWIAPVGVVSEYILQQRSTGRK